MDKVRETVVKLSEVGALAVPRATEACGPVENLLAMYFEDNPEATPDQAVEDFKAMRRVRPIRNFFDSCKTIKELLPQFKELFDAIMKLCPQTTTKLGAGICEGGLCKCLMSMLCPALCPTTGVKKEGACDCFSGICPDCTDLCPDVEPSPTPTPGSSWYVMDSTGVAKGPFDLATMTAMIGAKQVLASTKVAPSTSPTAWVEAGSEPTLKSLFA